MAFLCSMQVLECQDLTLPGSLFICGSSAQPPMASPLPAAGTSLAVQPAPGLGPALIPFPEAAQLPRPITPVGYGGYQPHPGQDLGYGGQPQEPVPAATTALSYQDSYSYGPSTAAAGYENKRDPPPAAGQPQLPAMATATLCPPGPQGAYGGIGYNQAQPLPQVPTAEAGQLASTLPSASTYPPVSSTQPAASFLSTLPSSSSFGLASAPYTGPSYPIYDASPYSAASPHYPSLLLPRMRPPPLPEPVDSSLWGGAGSSPSARRTDSFAKKLPVAAKLPKPRGGPKQLPLHYCDVCKISCAGPQVFKLHTKLGKPIPSMDPAPANSAQATSTSQPASTPLTAESPPAAPASPSMCAPSTPAPARRPAALKASHVGPPALPAADGRPPQGKPAHPRSERPGEPPAQGGSAEASGTCCDAQPVGPGYVEEVSAGRPAIGSPRSTLGSGEGPCGARPRGLVPVLPLRLAHPPRADLSEPASLGSHWKARVLGFRS
ncbi:zinc finger RNA-binding protein 2-like isoform X3 [Physeter macrocephalus]|uniref:Zinc finger RNA-binding protein 2-like isoform X3 n=1 Tax=Physeter macrocephalus TaxID=9755 RepID=A0A455B234_PHYMC|nr:zinc finger RNA-binding protein 2-like isoform X3 [Physeter catodon]|eukprot:XP_028342584.1 zinc finger RNA-binding protein 2-like isoform X3 [Physeter catodon]